jgi:hypothetical protein
MTPFKALAFATALIASLAGAARAQSCSAAQEALARDAQQQAFFRVQVALNVLRGLGAPPSPAGRQPMNAVAAMAHLKDLGQSIFGIDVTRFNTEEILGKMQAALAEGKLLPADKRLPLRCIPASDKRCGLRAGFVEQHPPPQVDLPVFAINLCPQFFASKPEQQVRTMVHESAHLARINHENEAYCAQYDCKMSCGGGPKNQWGMADNWSHFVHCASGHPADALDRITAPAHAAKKK